MAVNKYKTKKGARYQAALYLGGRRVATKSGFKTKREAKAWLRDEEKQWESSGGKTTTRTDFESAASEYLSWVKGRRKRNTFVYKRSTFRRFLDFYPARLPLNELSQELLERYHQNEKSLRGPKAANCDLNELSIFFNWAKKRGLMDSNPADPIERFSEDAYIRYVPPAEDIAAARLAANPVERRVFDTLYYTAARLSEILELTWEDVNFDVKVVRLWTAKRRGGNREPRFLAMHPELEKTLQVAWKERDKQSPYVFTNPNSGTHYSRHTAMIRDMFSNLCKRAEIEKPFTAHCIRHHVASRIADSRKATPRQIQQFLGHMNLRTTEIYLHELRVDHDILEAFDDPAEQQETAQK
jgi:integrase